jgi:hypothetical protein
MKMGLSVLFAFMSQVALAQNITNTLQIDRVFIPNGFDDNDNVQVVVQGTLNDTCWKVGESQTHRNGHEISVSVQGVQVGCFCIPVEVPYYKVIDLGKLRAGNYMVRIGDQKMIHQLTVDRAPTPTQDSHLYANVMSAYFDGSRLVLKGIHPDRSFYIKQIVVRQQSDGTIVVLPLVARHPIIRDFVTVPFTEIVDLHEHIEIQNTYLIHVRSMNGNAVNLVESFD